MEADRELMPKGAHSISEGLWRMVGLAQDAAESVDARIEDEDLDGRAEAVEEREALERLQALSLEVSEGIDAYPAAARQLTRKCPADRRSTDWVLPKPVAGAHTSLSTTRPDNGPRIRFPATLGEEPEVGQDSGYALVPCSRNCLH